MPLPPLDITDLTAISRVILGRDTKFPESPNWQAVATSYIALPTGSFHPDPSFVSDFWNPSQRTSSGGFYPYVADLQTPRRALVYANHTNDDSWLNCLYDFRQRTGVAAACRSEATFVLFKTGDVTGSANPYGFPVPDPSKRGQKSVANSSLNNSNPVPTAPDQAKASRKKYFVSLYATTTEPIHGFQASLRYDPEVVKVKKIAPNRSDLYRGDNQPTVFFGSKTNPLVRTTWYAADGRRRDFTRRPDRQRNRLSAGVLLYTLNIRAAGDLAAVAAAVEIAADDLPAQFYDRRGNPITDVDLELFVSELKPKSETAPSDSAPADSTELLVLYPNPTTEAFAIKSVHQLQSTTLVITDNLGREVARRADYRSGDQVSVGHLAAGTYRVALFTGRNRPVATNWLVVQ